MTTEQEIRAAWIAYADALIAKLAKAEPDEAHLRELMRETERLDDPREEFEC